MLLARIQLWKRARRQVYRGVFWVNDFEYIYVDREPIDTPSSANASVDFARAIKLLRREVRMKVSGLSDSTANKAKLRLAAGQIYMIFYEFNQDELGPHFRSLYHVFKLIENSAFDEATKIEYANIARSTLGKDQLFLLAVNCVSEHGVEFRPLIEKYGLLKHIDRRPSILNIDERIAKWCYRPTATMNALDRKKYSNRRD